MTPEHKRALKLYRGFREEAPGVIDVIEFDPPESVILMGPVEFIGYTTTHGRKAVRYTHEFQAGSRPNLYAGPDNRQLFFFGGRYRVTPRGIVDLDSRGREIDDGGGR